MSIFWQISRSLVLSAGESVTLDRLKQVVDRVLRTGVGGALICATPSAQTFAVPPVLPRLVSRNTNRLGRPLMHKRLQVDAPGEASLDSRNPGTWWAFQEGL